MSTILVIGTGHLGSWLVGDLVAAGHDVISTYFQHQPEGLPGEVRQLDIRNREAVIALVGEVKPDAIVNCAAVTDLDWAEPHRSDTSAVNLFGARNVADAGEENGGIRLIYISTAQVFDGYDGDYTEFMTPLPLNHYAHTKMLGGQQTERRTTPTLILRTGPLYSHLERVNNLATTITKALAAGEELRLIDDGPRNFTHVAHVSAAIIAALGSDNEKLWHPGGAAAIPDLQHAKRPGIYHCADPEKLTPFEFGQKLATALGKDPAQLRSIHQREMDWVAERPLLATLNTEKFAKDFAFEYPGLDAGIAKVAAELK